MLAFLGRRIVRTTDLLLGAVRKLLAVRLLATVGRRLAGKLLDSIRGKLWNDIRGRPPDTVRGRLKVAGWHLAA